MVRSLSGVLLLTFAGPGLSLFAPTAGSTWNIELDNVPNVSQADDPQYHIWDYDVLDAPQSTIAAFQAKGHPVICYFSAGTWENWRADANEFPAVAIGKPVDGWKGEKWLNVSNAQVRDIMVQRIASAQSKGCDGIDPDNIDGYENDTGFNLSQDDAVNYIQFLAAAANARGMACGLKNGGDIIDRVINVTAYAVNEQCIKYHECQPFQAFIQQNKPVFHLEYTGGNKAKPSFLKKACDGPGTSGFSTLVKHLSLNAWTTTCPSGTRTTNSSSTSSSPSATSSPSSTSKSNDANGRLGAGAGEIRWTMPFLLMLTLAFIGLP